MGATNCPETPRQKMIGMMYLVLTAMLALNVSADVLNGFTLVHASLNESKSTTEMQNTILYGQFEDLKSQNPGRVGEWLEKANAVKAKTAEMYQMIEDLKVDIVKQADGADGDVNNIKSKSNLDAGGQVALVTGRAKKMKEAIELYKDEMLKYVGKDSAKANYLNRTYNTGMITKENGDKISWEGAIFESMPVVASITLLTKVQADLKHTELEVVNYLKNQIDAGDFRVNKIEGLVISESNYVTRGGRYSAKIVLAAQDSTKKPTITVNGRELDGNEYIVQAGSVGTFPVKGTIRLPRPDGSTAEYDFESSYIVGEPTAIISADMMNVLYAGIQNPISVSVPGIPAQNINVSVNNGALSRTAKGWNINPRVGQDCNISVSAKMADGRVQTIGSKPFRVKPLPPPIAYIEFRDDKGNLQQYKGSRPFPKAQLVGSNGIRAALDDADLDVRYQVLGFDVNFFDSMGNTIVETSNNNSFSDKQMATMRQMPRGRKFFISRVRAKGPDGIERILPPIEVIVN